MRILIALEEASVESCMLDARWSTQHKEDFPYPIVRCLPQLTVGQSLMKALLTLPSF